MNEITLYKPIAYYEDIIEKSREEVGFALRQIKEGSLWKDTYLNFSHYCEKRWGFKRATVYYLMNEESYKKNLENKSTKRLTRENAPSGVQLVGRPKQPTEPLSENEYRQDTETTAQIHPGELFQIYVRKAKEIIQSTPEVIDDKAYLAYDELRAAVAKTRGLAHIGQVDGKPQGVYYK